MRDFCLFLAQLLLVFSTSSCWEPFYISQSKQNTPNKISATKLEIPEKLSQHFQPTAQPQTHYLLGALYEGLVTWEQKPPTLYFFLNGERIQVLPSEDVRILNQNNASILVGERAFFPGDVICFDCD